MTFLLDRPAGPQPAASRVEGDVLLIGRGTNAGLRLDDEAVALEHARIERNPAGYQLTDLGSVTGTYLNGKPLAGRAVFLKDGDTIEIGPYRLDAGWKAPGDALRLAVSLGTAPQAAGPVPVDSPEVDYVRAYGLRRPFLTKAFFSLALTAAAAAAVVALPRAGWYWAFQPGRINPAHERAQAGCLDCHKPWEGPVQARCAECHARPDHQPTQARTPDCSECHFEHRGTESLTLVDDGSCVSCHENLTVQGGGEPAVARNIRAFPEAHADFRVAKTDPTVLRFGHRKHLEKPMLTPEGERVRLECESCHVAASGAGPTEMRPVDYETACASCHLLTFDPSLADEAAPHGDPRRVREFLIAVYSDRRDQALSIREIRRRILREPEARPVIDLSARASRAVVEAERYLYGTACRECHEVDLEARPVPAVTPPGIPAGWLGAIPFPHDRHLRIAELACTDCHTTAAGSRETSDVLIPGIAFCGGCHGGNGKPPGKAAIRPGPMGCRGCHNYHPEDMG